MSPSGFRTKTPSHCHLALRRYVRLCVPSSSRARGDPKLAVDSAETLTRTPLPARRHGSPLITCRSCSSWPLMRAWVVRKRAINDRMSANICRGTATRAEEGGAGRRGRSHVQLINLANIAAYVIARIVLVPLSGQAPGEGRVWKLVEIADGGDLRR